VFDSHTELAKLFPMANMTLRWPGLQNRKKRNKLKHLSDGQTSKMYLRPIIKS
jgi:hypothetical protein